ncbi:MAG: TerB family tellurite resistance protein [Calditrichaceae bacterium]|nr:TerB family tellurite resistance protein [Calditrichaceae bacterium]MBN2707718.1 TerB family tellurite resistance protein [Calditrichaceae bacterium]RQV96466.1 MAG: TerB family tellurite resistance protein [Calditrichota bacterium]
MLKKLESLIRAFTSEPEEAKTSTEDQLMTAAAVLFLEMAYADFNITREEEDHLVKILEELFDLNPVEIDELLETAKESRANRQDIWKFTDLLKAHLTHEQKIRILENLWRLIFADSHIDRYEEALIRKITTLLGLEHGNMIETKLRIKAEMNN